MSFSNYVIHKDSSEEVSHFYQDTPEDWTIREIVGDMVRQNLNDEFDLSEHEDVLKSCFHVDNFDDEDFDEGGYGKVYECTDDKDEDVQFAIKVMAAKFTGQKYMDYWTRKSQNEIAILKQLKHSNIVKYLDHCWLDSDDLPRCNVAIKTEYLDCRLYDVLSYIPKMEYAWFKRFFKQISSALTYMHDEMGVAHLDLKSANIMIDHIESFELEDLSKDLVTSNWKIIDAGNAHIYSGPKEQALESRFFLGTIPFKCPGKMNKKSYQPFKSDSYSLGMLLWQCIVGLKNIFQDEPSEEGPNNREPTIQPAWEIIENEVWPKLVDEGVKIGPHHLVARMLVAPEEDRIFVSEALELFDQKKNRIGSS